MEAILNADYDTTMCMLGQSPHFLTLDFWKEKCQKMYPKGSYLDSFSGLENLLLKERTFVLTIDDTNDPVISNMLIEYNDILEKQLKSMKLLTDRILRHVMIDVEKQFVLIKRGDDDVMFVFNQFDVKDDCYEIIEKDAVSEIYDCDYYILDMALFTLSDEKLSIVNYKNYEWITGGKYNKFL